jgi:hypothetical protein
MFAPSLYSTLKDNQDVGIHAGDAVSLPAGDDPVAVGGSRTGCWRAKRRFRLNWLRRFKLKNLRRRICLFIHQYMRVSGVAPEGWVWESRMDREIIGNRPFRRTSVSVDFDSIPGGKFCN